MSYDNETAPHTLESGQGADTRQAIDFQDKDSKNISISKIDEAEVVLFYDWATSIFKSYAHPMEMIQRSIVKRQNWKPMAQTFQKCKST